MNINETWKSKNNGSTVKIVKLVPNFHKKIVYYDVIENGESGFDVGIECQGDMEWFLGNYSLVS
jgi:hypothetical protein